MLIVTVVHSNKAFGAPFQISYKKRGQIRATFYSDAWDAGAAAAAAMDIALRDKHYAIFAPDSVLKCIPEELRSNLK